MLKTCHFCSIDTDLTFMYAVQEKYKKKYGVSACSHHFDILYDMTYIVGNEVGYLSKSQRELMAIKRLEKDLKIKNRV